MQLEVTKDVITATREAGDRSKGYGAISKKPLPGEDVLVRRLSDAVSQSIDKGLAKKVWTPADNFLVDLLCLVSLKLTTRCLCSLQVPPKKQTRLDPVATAPVTSLQSAGEVGTANESVPKAADTGPRQSGARRSTPRDRRGNNSNTMS